MIVGDCPCGGERESGRRSETEIEEKKALREGVKEKEVRRAGVSGPRDDWKSLTHCHWTYFIVQTILLFTNLRDSSSVTREHDYDEQ